MFSIGGNIRMQPYNPNNPRQQWMVQGNRIINRYNPQEVLDIVGQQRQDGARLCAYQYKRTRNQHWRIEYV